MAVVEASGALDVVVLRGHCTAAAISLAYQNAKEMTTTLLLWDRQHKAADEEGVATLRKQQYGTHEEEKPDQQVMSKAFEFFGAGTPKCALVHVASDKLKQSNQMENYLQNYDAVVSGIKDNHTETIQSFIAVSVYEPWLHAYRATAFLLIPSVMQYDWPDDLCTANCSVRRTVKADPLRYPDGSGWTVGLQMTTENHAAQARLAYGSMKSILADEGLRHAVSGKNVRIEEKGHGAKAIMA